ncbi:MAG: histidine kinase [Pseudolysinimonas sp.]
MISQPVWLILGMNRAHAPARDRTVEVMFRRLTQLQLVFDIALGSGWFLLSAFVGGFHLTSAAVALGMGAALALRRVSPALALIVAWAFSIGQVSIGASPQPANLAILPVLYATAAYGSRRLRWVGFVSSFLGAAVITVSLLLPNFSIHLSSVGPTVIAGTDAVSIARSSVVVFVGSTAAFLLSWTMGLLTSIWRQSWENRRAVAVVTEEMVAEQERVRIARDMHDVVAHSLAVVVAQADGARYLGSKDPAATDAALATIATTAREALSDVRVLLAQLRHTQDDSPQPTLVDLDRLFEQLRGSGLKIAKQVSGIPLALGTGQQLAVYRIVQESLTNALRHADPGHEVAVHFGWTVHGLDLTISSVLLAAKTTRTGRTAIIGAPTAGHGIAGMTERAALVGGHLTAGVDASSGATRFVVHAWLPERAVVSS